MTALSIALICVFVQVALTFLALVRMGKVRVKSHVSKEVSYGDVALDTRNYPDTVKQYQNNVTNQFETPTLFYAVVAIGAALDSVSWMVAIGAVIYVISRLVHHFIHVGTNHVRKRFNAFVAGLFGLLISWVGLAIALL